MLEKPRDYKVDPNKNSRYQPIVYCTSWSVLFYFNNWNIIKFTNKKNQVKTLMK